MHMLPLSDSTPSHDDAGKEHRQHGAGLGPIPVVGRLDRSQTVQRVADVDVDEAPAHQLHRLGVDLS